MKKRVSPFMVPIYFVAILGLSFIAMHIASPIDNFLNGIKEEIIRRRIKKMRRSK